ncbi:4-hydroxyphenylacetate 3-monooxygenase, oxygenase component [Georgenia ruanii]|uniref:4-hydroxyphenylacetate 3-monooxygenase, oxygenase component n=1 Tax=Georgenia ruanii TaxID=348442 RepID=A0A7J9V0Y4_9MICO|nr:4-hydroxyphenylacetate 3-monooxygenase, oxygenase component [Georgenia ruanii]MPV90538.1 4-hydroxyphenylacetate 3-monooxygenase, oxygenase component [Georgenia ruanii]
MGARTGADYLEALKNMHPTIHLDGETITGDVAEHPAFAGVVKTYAELYDMQHDERTRDLTTYTEGGGRYGTSFMVPRSAEDLASRREAASAWARHSAGMLGRTGDYLNAALTALSQAQDWFADTDPAFGENARKYYEYARDNDVLTTHTLIPPQVNRSVAVNQQGDGQVSAHIVREDDNGIVVRGARMLATIAPFAEEVLVFPSTVLKGGPDDAKYSFAFAIQNDAPGLRYLCRKSLHSGGGAFNEPLASRFEEMDAVVIFDDVHVPWERVFMLGSPEKCNGFYNDTGATSLMTHQVVSRTTVKSEFYAGLLMEMADAIGIDQFPHIREDIASVLVAAEMGRSALRASEADGAINRYGFFQPRWASLNAARNWYPKVFQQFPAIVRKFGASGLMALPDEADVLGGQGADDVATYLQSRNLTGVDRVKLFRLAFDAAISSFAGRQTLYEYYFFGDPIRMASAFVDATDTEPLRQRVRDLLERTEDPVGEALQAHP